MLVPTLLTLTPTTMTMTMTGMTRRTCSTTGLPLPRMMELLLGVLVLILLRGIESTGYGGVATAATRRSIGATGERKRRASACRLFVVNFFVAVVKTLYNPLVLIKKLKEQPSPHAEEVYRRQNVPMSHTRHVTTSNAPTPQALYLLGAHSRVRLSGTDFVGDDV